ncbi:MAG: cereblon family protein [Thermodesulfobacteriota bacterium]|nr:cereblon family protein [Thermodesulfobacteriota bacterium]
MIPSNNTSYLFRQPYEKCGGEKPGYLVEDETEEKEPDVDKYILCRQCRRIITTSAERIEIQGAHQHTFANPHGSVYQIGCFRSASGCGYAGQASDEFSWFTGYSWRIAVCGSCLFHLGWLFISPGSQSFNGLILDHLIHPS